jgi:hypothetical protein
MELRDVRTIDELNRASRKGGRELSERELMEVSGGDGPPSTAGDGNGRVYLHSLRR